MQVQRRKRDSEIRESSIDISMSMREHIDVGPEVKSSHDMDTPLTSIDQSLGGHVPLRNDISSLLRSVFPICFDCLYSQVDISVDVAGTVDETEGSQDVGSFVAQDVGSVVGQDVVCCDGIG